MSDIPAEFLEKIKEAKDKQLQELNLCGNESYWLTEIPAEVFELKHLRKLDLSTNKITIISLANNYNFQWERGEDI